MGGGGGGRGLKSRMFLEAARIAQPILAAFNAEQNRTAREAYFLNHVDKKDVLEDPYRTFYLQSKFIINILELIAKYFRTIFSFKISSQSEKKLKICNNKAHIYCKISLIFY